jgi:8-oxo-dGTP pyrophosphatase MutT (NUDIX family)
MSRVTTKAPSNRGRGGGGGPSSGGRRRGGAGARGGGRANGDGGPSGTLFEVSAGGVIYRRDGDRISICLIATKGGTRWQLPKGKREDGESLEETAAREVAEETGLTGRVGARLEKIDLWFTWNDGGVPVRHHKIVYFFLLEYERGDTADHDDEVEDARWFDADEALQRLTFANERRVVTRALAMIAGGEAAREQRGRP